MKEKTQYQEFALNQLLSILQKYNAAEIKNNKGIYDVVYMIIRWYPEITNDGHTTYNNVFSYKTYFKATNKAYSRLNQPETKNTEYLSMEHTPAVSEVLLRMLVKAQHGQINKNDIEEILKDYDVVIMTKEQCSIINKKMKSTGTLEERLRLIDDQINDETKSRNLFVDNIFNEDEWEDVFNK